MGIFPQYTKLEYPDNILACKNREERRLIELNTGLGLNSTKIGMLKAVGRGVNKRTPLMLEVQLSWRSLNENLNDLVNAELLTSLQADGGQTTYILTPKGERAVRAYEQLMSLMRFD